MRALQNQSLRRRSTAPAKELPRPGIGKTKSILLVVVVLALAIFAGYHYSAMKSVKSDAAASTAKTASKSTTPTTKASNSTPVATVKTTACTSNTMSKLILVSISQRHLWACSGSTMAYDSAVITGMENLAAD